MMHAVLNGILVLGLVGFVLGIVLSVAYRLLAVKVDPRQEEIESLLPGANCGACGFPGCSGYAAAVVAGEAPPNRCTVGGMDVAAAIAKIMGVEAGDVERRIAFVFCKGDESRCSSRAVYEGVSRCSAAALVAAGHKACTWGCLGLGDCERACPFDAIHVGDDGLPHVDAGKCTGCGRCVEACPRDIIEVMPESQTVLALCSNVERGAVVKQVCSVGCTGCGLCAKVCPVDAIEMKNNLPHVDFLKCTGCGECVRKCPTGSMTAIGISVEEPGG